MRNWAAGTVPSKHTGLTAAIKRGSKQVLWGRAWLSAGSDVYPVWFWIAGATQEQEIQGMMQLLQRKKLVRRTERLYKKPKPGRKRLTKWPRKLEHVPENEQASSATTTPPPLPPTMGGPTRPHFPSPSPTLLRRRMTSQLLAYAMPSALTC